MNVCARYAVLITKSIEEHYMMSTWYKNVSKCLLGIKCFKCQFDIKIWLCDSKWVNIHIPVKYDNNVRNMVLEIKMGAKRQDGCQ